MTVASPCINVCRMHPRTGLCEGCLRTIDEITVWSRLDDADKLSVLAQIDRRREALRAERRAAAPGQGDPR
jgi:predicted Fe-S protein YdhL (DUF1289 family)